MDPAAPVWDDAMLSQNAWASMWELMHGLLDKLGVAWHRHEISSRTYKIYRHFFYSCIMTHLMLLCIFVFCFLTESNPRCGPIVGAWIAAVLVCILHGGAYRAVGSICLCACRRLYRCGWLRVSPSLWLTGLRHILALLLVLPAVSAALWVTHRSGLNESKAFMVSCAAACGLVCAQWSARGAFRLMELELRALQVERRARRERIAGSVLTFADILEVRRGTAAEECPQVLEQQPVVNYDPEALGEQTECCICSAAFDSDSEIRRAHCGHCFHSECLSNWLARSLTCPLCREDLGQHVRQCEAQRLERQLAQLVGLPRALP